MSIVTTGHSFGWILAGFAGQALFTSRFVVQWVASERVQRSVVPHLFWYLSMAGGTLLLGYAIHRRDPVFIAGQATGLLVYGRNLWLICRAKRGIEPPRALR
jgi:lipid-A-disaccharide synthase-like uncharacterized protein